MIAYRISRYEADRGLLTVEYGPRGSGITTTVDATFVKTPEDVHRLCRKACPVADLERLERIKLLDHEALGKSIGEYEISATEAAAISQERKVVVLDTRAWNGAVSFRPRPNPTGPAVILGQDRHLFVRHMTFEKAGDMELRHQHQFDHHTVLFKGRAQFLVRGKLQEVSAPAMVFIEAYTDHEIVALEDDTQCACIHNIANLERLA